MQPEEALHSPHEYNVRIGHKLRQIRKDRSITQKDMADILGVSYQQIQKYERGIDRLSASSLFYLCEELDLTIYHFYDYAVFGDDPSQHMNALCKKEEKLIHALRSIKDRSVQASFLDLVQRLAERDN